MHSWLNDQGELYQGLKLLPFDKSRKDCENLDMKENVNLIGGNNRRVDLLRVHAHTHTHTNSGGM